MREWVTKCDFCGHKIRSLEHTKIKTEINLGYKEYDICWRCEWHMIRYILKARKAERNDEG